MIVAPITSWNWASVYSVPCSLNRSMGSIAPTTTAPSANSIAASAMGNGAPGTGFPAARPRRSESATWPSMPRTGNTISSDAKMSTGLEYGVLATVPTGNTA